MVAPSDMMDGRVRAIREMLDEHGHVTMPIMSYAVKYASSFYGPFREAADSALPLATARATRWIRTTAERPFARHCWMWKKAQTSSWSSRPCRIWIWSVRSGMLIDLPVAAYSVSGEYAMVKAAAAKGWIDEERIISEMAISAYRAGVDIYITYYAKELAKLMEEGRIG